MKKENISEDDIKKLYKYSNLILKEYPFNLKALTYKMYSSTKLDMKEEMKKNLRQFQTIMGAIMSSGNGLQEDSAFYVIQVSDEYEVLDILGFQFANQQKLVRSYDYLEVVENPYKVKGLYFEISPSLFFP